MATLLLAAPVVLSGSATGSTASGGTLAVSRTSGIPGEALTVKVTALPGPAARSVRLDRCVGYSGSTCSYWVAVMSATTSNHAYTFSTRVHAMEQNRYRVYAAATSTDGARLTPSLRVDGLQQDASIALPKTATVGSTVTVTLGSGTGPIRAGREMSLQRRNADGTWTWVAGPFALDSTGKATASLTLDSAGTRTYRAVARDWAPAGTNTLVGWFPSFPATVVVS
ncbi:hypothetical protein [Nocardioides jejuensis]|uniref:Bacterial Ig-like domain-containing protein n=1 Tax=Nocardioides jejuensis TaxID=2502782 RepID=A0A4R1CJ10_9ACTN|nr:hypothetical protein [Nocardioides jejuensis]TCJ30817.1 hypothetical protein EPD65_01915 [Nocardioides jejuensis]